MEQEQDGKKIIKEFLNKPQDKEIACLTCGENFIWSSGEQGFFISKGLRSPKHCPECRRKRKQSIDPPPEKT